MKTNMMPETKVLLNDLAHDLNSFATALFYKTTNEEFDTVVYFAAVKRFGFVGRKFFDYLAEKADLTGKEDDHDDFIEAIIKASAEKEYITEEESAHLEVMAALITDTMFYDPQDFVGPEEFKEEMQNQYRFLNDFLSKEYDVRVGASPNPFKVPYEHNESLLSV